MQSLIFSMCGISVPLNIWINFFVQDLSVVEDKGMVLYDGMLKVYLMNLEKDR